MITVILYLKKIGWIDEHLKKEKAPRYSAGQPNIAELESSTDRKPQQEGEDNDTEIGK